MRKAEQSAASMPELLAKLASKTQSLEGMPPGNPVLVGCELAGVLSGLPRGPYLLARAAWVGDDSVREELDQILLVRASKWFKPKDIAYPGMLRALCSATTSQAIDPPRCRRCSGRGLIFYRGGRVSDCERCSGSGKGLVGGERVRRLLGLSTGHWKQIQRPREKIETTVWSWRALAAGHVNRKLREIY